MSTSVNGTSLALSMTSEGRPKLGPAGTAVSMNLAGRRPRLGPRPTIATSLPAATPLLALADTALLPSTAPALRAKLTTAAAEPVIAKTSATRATTIDGEGREIRMSTSLFVRVPQPCQLRRGAKVAAVDALAAEAPRPHSPRSAPTAPAPPAHPLSRPAPRPRFAPLSLASCRLCGGAGPRAGLPSGAARSLGRVSRPASLHVCSDCAHSSPKWFGQCPGCGAWNTLVEERAPAAGAGRGRLGGGAAPVSPVPLAEVRAPAVERLETGIGELDRVLGGGLVPGSLVLLGGSPGIGKSTLTAMALGRLTAAGRRTLYVTGEESAAQVALRARRP